MPQPLRAVAAAALFLLHPIGAIELPPCDPSNLGSCSAPHLFCMQGLDRCVCSDGFRFDSSAETLDLACAPVAADPSADSSDGSSWAAVLATLLVLALLAALAVFVDRRYRLFKRAFRKMCALSGRDDPIVYEDVMIGQDDPPVAA